METFECILYQYMIAGIHFMSVRLISECVNSVYVRVMFFFQAGDPVHGDLEVPSGETGHGSRTAAHRMTC